MKSIVDAEAFNLFCFPRDKEDHEAQPLHELTDQQTKVHNLAAVGWDAKQIAERIGIPVTGVYDSLAKIRHWGYLS